MGTCHPMATLKYIDSVTSLPQIYLYKVVLLKLLKGYTVLNDQIKVHYLLKHLRIGLHVHCILESVGTKVLAIIENRYTLNIDQKI